MDRGKGKIPTDKNQELLDSKNTLATKEGVNKESVKQLIDDKNAVKRDSAVKAIGEQSKGQEVRVPKLEGNDYYKNNPLPKPKEPTPSTAKKGNSLKGVGQQIAKGMEEIFEKATPYIDDIAKGAGGLMKVGGVASGIVGFINPESTATDEQMRLDELNAEHSIEQTTLETSMFSSNEERDEVFQTISSFENEKPDFLKDLDPDIEMEYGHVDMSTPDIGGREDAGDGGDDGGDD